ncbi:putative FBD-associated F-box protein At5g56430 [Gossypium arboreum]|nr:putative FBD-associated F-box protein At5g56430 [Gossypium arboreum]
MGGCLPEWKILLANSPCLDTLVLDFEFSGSELESHNNGRDETEKVPGCLMYKVKIIKLLSFQGKPFESQVVEYLLKNAKVLERFTVRLSGKKRLRTKISKEVRALSRVSKKCQVTII